MDKYKIMKVVFSPVTITLAVLIAFLLLIMLAINALTYDLKFAKGKFELMERGLKNASPVIKELFNEYKERTGG